MPEQPSKTPPVQIVCTHCNYAGPGERAMMNCGVWRNDFCPRCGYLALPIPLAGGTSS